MHECTLQTEYKKKESIEKKVNFSLEINVVTLTDDVNKP